VLHSVYFFSLDGNGDSGQKSDDPYNRQALNRCL
jgi:hypothetical protein